MYKYFQPNKLDIKDKEGDCVIRALVKATGKTWIEVFDELIPYARRLQTMPNCKKAYEAYLKDQGFVYIGISNKKGTKRPTVQSFSKTNKQTCVLRIANHIVTSESGNYYDTWDCGKKSLWNSLVKR